MRQNGGWPRNAAAHDHQRNRVSTSAPAAPTTRPDVDDSHDVPDTLAEGHAPRNLGLLDQLGLWGNLGISLLSFAGAAYVLNPLGEGAGMGLVPAVLALVIGTVVGAGGISLMALASSRTGQPAMVMLRGLFGAKLSYLPTVLNIIQLIGWGTFEIIVMTKAITTLWDVSRTPLVIVVGALATLLALYPLHWVKVLRKYVTVAVILVLIYLAFQLGTSDIPAHKGSGWNGFLVAVDIMIGLSVSWVPVAGDYARHSTSNKAAVTGTWLGYSLSQIAVYGMGIMALLIAGNDGTKIFGVLTAVALGTLCFWVLCLREIDQCFIDVYSTTVSIQNLLPRVSRKLISLVLGVVSTVLALAVDMEGYASFLGAIGSVFVPLLGVFVVDYFLFGRGRTWNTAENAPSRPLMLLPWLLGFVAYYLIYPGTLGWWSQLWTNVDKALHFTAPHWLPASLGSFVVAALLTVAVEMFAKRSTLSPSKTSNHEE